MLYGEPYEYTGSCSSDPTPIPPEIDAIIDRLSTELSLAERPNSVLINHFPDSSSSSPSRSHLEMHSDDEKTILPDSKIITISVGATRKIVFEPKQCEGQQLVELNVRSNSMYVMSRSSQN